MFINMVSSLFDTFFALPALAARCQARFALDAGDYGRAADYYLLTDYRLAGRVLFPVGSHPLIPSRLRASAQMAVKIAVEEGQRKKNVFEDLKLKEETIPNDFFRSDDIALSMFVGASMLRSLSPQEEFLLAIHRPQALSALLSDSGAELFQSPTRSRQYRGIRRLFLIRHLAALAEQGDRKALYDLVQTAIHSESALRALHRLEEAGVAEAYEHRAMADYERHTMFLAAQARERQRLEDEIRMLRYLP